MRVDEGIIILQVVIILKFRLNNILLNLLLPLDLVFLCTVERSWIALRDLRRALQGRTDQKNRSDPELSTAPPRFRRPGF